MDREEIINYVGNRRIFWRGESYYENGKIVSFTKTGNKIRAFSLGSRNRRYNVKIEFNKDGGIEEAYCACPYFKSGYICKHIAAVLIYYHEEYPFNNPIVRDKKEFIEEKEIPFPIGTHITDDPLLEILSEFSVSEKDFSTINYRLVFVVDYLYNYYKQNYSDNWIIKPGLQYIKKNGDYGRITKFNKNNFNRKCTEEEMRILNKIDSGQAFDMFRTYIRQIKEHKIPTYIEIDRNSFPITFVPIKKIEIKFKINEINERLDEYYFSPYLIITDDAGTIYDVELFNEMIIDPFNIWLINMDGIIFYKENDKAGYLILKSILKNNIIFLASQIDRIKKFIKKNKIKLIKIDFNQKSIKISYPIPKPYIEIKQGFINELKFKLMFDYGYNQVKLSDTFDYINFIEGEEVKLCKRNSIYEENIQRYIRNRFSKIIRSSIPGHYSCKMMLIDFLIKYGGEFLDEGIELRVGGERVKDSKRGRIAYRVTSGIDWFEVEAKFIDEDKNELEVDFDLMNMKDGILRVGDTFLVLNKADIKKLIILKEEGLNVDGKLKVSKYNFQIINELYNNIINNQDSEIKRIQMIYKKLINFTKIENVKIPKGLKGKLRDYQYAGLTWLNFLHQYNLNGCLADDMGLGKTIQALSLLLKLKEKKKKSTSLIVVPVSTILNWENEIRKFAPSLTYILHYGLQRTESIEALKKFDIIISSYHTLRNDILLLNKMKYHYIILDESQYIKNSSTQIFKAIRSLAADNRLTLTGTPIENNTLELWSQMEFLNPTLLGSRREFIKKFTKPIEANKDKWATEKLRKIVFPFILRRKKEDVLKELPKKTEIIQYSKMDKEQRKLYTELKLYLKSQIMNTIAEKGVKKSSIQIFAALLRLRQAALFPGLINKKYKGISSCKYEQFKEMIDEILEEKHKVVVFSQFVQVLKILKAYLTHEKIPFSYFDGSTPMKKRQKQIDNFQNDPDLRVMLISLKAGGFGINLTAADYVIIFDPWWNPAVETQAIDRTHRIGQNKKVFAYKMIVKDTVEEKILELQRKKKKLADEIITTESGFFKTIKKAEILDLFS